MSAPAERPADAAVTGSRAPLHAEDDWARLRSLLLGRERATLEALEARLGSQECLARSVAEVLAAAVTLRGRADEPLTAALTPVVEESLNESVRSNPQPLVDALYPIMGPAIRRSIAETLADMIQAFNRAVEVSLSPRALMWRLDAWRSGQSYASVVLLKTLVYRVEQVFLIHRESGLLLGHVEADQVHVQDPDMVSGMLTAVRDFLSDSFQVGREEGVDTIRMGALSLLVRVGPRAVLAAVVRGTAPEQLPVRLSETLEAVHRQYDVPLRRFAGDDREFSTVEAVLRPCLSAQARTPARTRGWRVWLLPGLIVALLAALLAQRYRSQEAWDGIVSDLEHEPGLLVVAEGRQGPRSLQGLRDPLARDPLAVIGPQRARRSKVVWEWKPFLSLDPPIVLARAREVLRPPPGLSLRLDGDILRSSGTAPRAWLLAARTRALLVPGIGSYDDSAVLDAARASVSRVRETLAATALYFDPGSDQLGPGQRDRLASVGAALRSLEDAAALLGIGYTVEIVGRADTPGSTAFNLRLSRGRANAVRESLVAQGIASEALQARGIGATELAANAGVEPVGPAEADRDGDPAQRRVNLALRVGPPSRGADAGHDP